MRHGGSRPFAGGEEKLREGPLPALILPEALHSFWAAAECAARRAAADCHLSVRSSKPGVRVPSVSLCPLGDGWFPGFLPLVESSRKSSKPGLS